MIENDSLDTLDLIEAADYLKVHTNTVLNLVKAERISAAKIGEKLVFFKTDLAKYLRAVIREQSEARHAGEKIKSEVSTTRGKRAAKPPPLPTMEQITGAASLP